MATPSTFECGICATDKSTPPEPVLIAGDTVCENCIKESIVPKFTATLQHEFDYPVKWGKIEVSPYVYSKFLPEGFAVEWRKREMEYRIPIIDRLYCQRANCGSFVGSRSTFDRQTVVCEKCSYKTCGTCHSLIDGEERVHSCQASGTLSAEDSFQGVKGRDYQLCPGPVDGSCGIRVYLTEGCNYIICRCGEGFCFICGERTEHNGQHFGRSCPMYNQPDSQHAQWAPAWNEVLGDVAAQELRRDAAILDLRLLELHDNEHELRRNADVLELRIQEVHSEEEAVDEQHRRHLAAIRQDQLREL